MLEYLNDPLFGTPEAEDNVLGSTAASATVLTYVCDCVGADGVTRRDYIDDPARDPIGVVTV